ncbi:MAG: hypothetical protein P1V35_03080 [Planctomycetota bacterium]|nr:hypothetical protein [Planctomycetota bacterium]
MRMKVLGKDWIRGWRTCLLVGVVALFASDATAQVSVQGRASQQVSPGQTKVDDSHASEGSLRPLAIYSPLGHLGGVYVPFWKKHLPDDAGTFSFVVDLKKPIAAGGAIVWYTLGGSAQEGLHYSVPGSNPLILSPGTTSFTIPIQILNPGRFYKEVSIEFELTQALGMGIHEEQRFGQLWIRSSTPPPTISVPDGPFFVTPSGETRIPVQLSAPSLEPVHLHYTVDSASTLTEYAFAPSGTAIIPAGQTSVELRLLAGPSAIAGQELTLNLRHERSGVNFVVPALEQELTFNPDLYPQEIHLDENLWSFSVGGVQEFESHELYNPAAFGPSHPGIPTDNITGGSFWSPGQENQQLIDLLDQADPSPLMDPFSHVPLKIYAVADAASGVVPYLRKSFNGAFCGANTQLYKLPEYTRVSYYIAMPEGLDAGRGVPFFRIGMRVRTQNMNHGVSFRIGSNGLDADGGLVITVPTSLGPIGLWDRYSVDSRTDKFGIVEDEFGVRVWFAHKLDPTVPFIDEHGLPHRETPGFDSGNPIEYPAWLSSGDGSLPLAGIASNNMDDAIGRGNLIYGLMWEVSDDASLFSGNLRPYFPKPGAWWEPQGNAVITDSTSLNFVVQ